MNKLSVWYRNGYDNAAIRFAYIPDFPNRKAKKEWEAGYKAGMAKNKSKEVLKDGK